MNPRKQVQVGRTGKADVGQQLMRCVDAGCKRHCLLAALARQLRIARTPVGEGRVQCIRRVARVQSPGTIKMGRRLAQPSGLPRNPARVPVRGTVSRVGADYSGEMPGSRGEIACLVGSDAIPVRNLGWWLRGRHPCDPHVMRMALLVVRDPMLLCSTRESTAGATAWSMGPPAPCAAQEWLAARVPQLVEHVAQVNPPVNGRYRQHAPRGA